MHAALAQSVERRLGKAEVGGSIPLGSLYEKVLEKDTPLIGSIFLLRGIPKQTSSGRLSWLPSMKWAGFGKGERRCQHF